MDAKARVAAVNSKCGFVSTGGGGSTGLSSCAPSVVDSRLATLLKTIARNERLGLGIAAHLVDELQKYVASGECEMKVAYGPADAAGVKPVIGLRAFLQVREQRDIVRDLPSLTSVTTIDVTFSPGNSPVQLMALVGHCPESGGDSVPLCFMVFLGSYSDGALSELFEWFFDQAAEVGIALSAITFADKCTATARAWATVAHKRLEGAAGKREALVALLELGAAGATPDQCGAARLLLNSLRDAAHVEATLAAADLRRAAAGGGGGDGGAAAAGGAAAPAAGAGADADGAAAPLPASASSSPLDMAYLREAFTGLPDAAPLLGASARALLKDEVCEQYGPILPGLFAMLLEDLKSAQAKCEAVRGESAAAFCDANQQLQVHAAVWEITGAAGSYLRTFCLPLYALCYYHAGAAMKKNAAKTTSGIAKEDRPAALLEFQAIYFTATSREDALARLGVYEEKWADRANPAWFSYLRNEWLAPSVCALLLLCTRDSAARLFILTTNSAELLFNILKNFWLKGRRTVDYVQVLTALVGTPGDNMGGLVGAKIKVVRDRVFGAAGRTMKTAIFRLAAATADFADSVAAGDVSITAVRMGVYKIVSATPLTVFTQPGVEQPSAHIRPGDFKRVPFYTVAARTQARIDTTLALARASAAAGPAPPRTAEANAAAMVGSLAAYVAHLRKDQFSELSGFKGLARSSPQLFDAERCMPSVLVSALKAVVLLRGKALSDGTKALRAGAGRGYAGSALTSADAAASLAQLKAVQGGGGGAGGAVAGLALSPALERDFELNRATAAAFEMHGGAPLRGSDWGTEAPPSVGVVYVVGVKVPARVIDALCERYLRRGIEVSLMDGKPVPDGLRLVLFELEHLAAALVQLGRGDELLTVLYVGSECKGEGLERFLRYWDHMMGAHRGAAAGPGNDVLSQFVRFTSKKTTGVALTPVTEPVLGNNDRVCATQFFRVIAAFTARHETATLGAEAFVAAVAHGRGSPLSNNSPPGEKARYYHAFGAGVPRAVIELTAAIEGVGGVTKAQSVGLADVKNALVARRLAVQGRLLLAGVTRSTGGGDVAPALGPGRFSVWQCASALGAVGDETASEDPFYVITFFDYCSRCASLRRHGARPCKHVITCRGFHVHEQLARGIALSAVRQPWWSRDTAAYLKNFLVLPRVLSAAPAAPPAAAGSRMISASGFEELTHQFRSMLALTAPVLRAASASVISRGAVTPDDAHASLELVYNALKAAGNELEEIQGGDVFSHEALSTVSAGIGRAAAAARAALGREKVVSARARGGGVAGTPDPSARSAAEVAARRADRLTGPFLEHVQTAAAGGGGGGDGSIGGGGGGADADADVDSDHGGPADAADGPDAQLGEFDDESSVPAGAGEDAEADEYADADAHISADVNQLDVSMEYAGYSEPDEKRARVDER